MRRWLAGSVTTAMLLMPAFAFAQDLPEAGAARDGQGGGQQYKETTTYDFEGDDVTGNLVKPNESNIQAQQHGKTSNLIDIRSDFIPEMMKTVEDL